MNRLKTLDWHKWYVNTMTFLAPLVVLYLTFVVANINADGFQVSDFALNDVVIGAGVLYILNVALDFFKKFKNAYNQL